VREAEAVVERWLDGHGLGETYEIVVYRNEKQRQMINKLSGCGEY